LLVEWDNKVVFWKEATRKTEMEMGGYNWN